MSEVEQSIGDEASLKNKRRYTAALKDELSPYPSPIEDVSSPTEWLNK